MHLSRGETNVTYRWKLYATVASFAAVLAIAGCGEEKKEEQAAAPAARSSAAVRRVTSVRGCRGRRCG